MSFSLPLVFDGYKSLILIRCNKDDPIAFGAIDPGLDMSSLFKFVLKTLIRNPVSSSVLVLVQAFWYKFFDFVYVKCHDFTGTECNNVKT